VSKTQAVTLGGADAAGRDCCNAVTLAFLNAYASVPVSDPHCFVRWHRNLDDNTWSRSLDLLSSGRSMPQLVNDHEVAPALIAVGMEPEDAWNYAIVGCNEVGVPGRAWQCAYPRGIAINDVEVLDHVLRRQPEARTDGDALLNAYEQEVLQRTRRSIQGRIRTNARLADERPFPLTSALMQGCADAGDDYHRGMPYSDLFAAYVRGTTNATNALAALNKVVWEDREMTVEALLSAVDADDAPVMERLHRCPRWGQDDERADCWAVRLSQRRTAAMQQAASEAGLPPIVCCHVVRSLHHTDGARLGPTPDGRPGRSPVADSIGAAPGDATHGPTAMLNSVLKLNARRDYAGIYNLNVTLPGGAASSPPVLRALVEAFFADGGQELQINVLDAATLRAARQNPDLTPASWNWAPPSRTN
jgi:formate C-acetyltransferase